ncbi:uncharacterized protein LOC126736254 [Anthonomus grandis grandis]|uniref:uncharacterized protein LOC126736254 n=1 Tax=Anthonomus grandis grandis TaxID=2921223 RepID=UPI002165C572|nr:uncharacterized protein LOC126736254 [Anthonomus grandis grandis]
MEVLDKQLNDNNPVLVSQVFSRLVENTLKTKTDGKQEYNYLKQKCLNGSNLISTTARLAIIKLVANKVFNIDQVLADLVTSISTARNTASLTKIIMNLLHVQFKVHAAITKFEVAQHPIIKALQADSHTDLQVCIYNEIVQSVLEDNRLNILYEPLYMYCICSPAVKTELSLLKQKLWSFLVQNDLDNKSDVVFKLCSFIQVQRRHSKLTGFLLTEFLQSHRNNLDYKHLEYMILLQILVIHNMILNNQDCRILIKTVLTLLPNVSFCHHNLCLLLLSKSVLVCSPLYLEELFNLCYYFAQQNVCASYSYFTLKSTILNWLAGPCMLTQEALKIAREILKLEPHVCRKRPEIFASRLNINKFNYLAFCNPEIFLCLQLGIKMECTKDISKFIFILSKAPLHFLKNCFQLLCGLLLNPNLDIEGKLEILAMVVKCSTHYLELLPVALTTVLYLLSNSQDNRLHFQLLKVLPQMARVKENVPKVLATIKAIATQSPVLANVALKLMYDTWEIENKCYSSLEMLAVQNVTLDKHDLLERNVVKSYVFMKLCEKRPELYGKDLVAHLSKILNECTDPNGAVPTSIALDGIRNLCKAETIDMITTWATLAPKFKNDIRPPVIKSLCGLVSEIPNLHYTQSYDELNDDVIKTLWNYVVESHTEIIVESALDALSKFDFGLICLHIPEIYLEEGSGKLSAVGDQRVVQGKVWLKFLCTHKYKGAARSFLINLVTTEINNYLKYVYQLKSQREPENYGSLPSHSVVRALGEHVKHNVIKVLSEGKNSSMRELYLDCLKILSLKYSKPLPPLDWCFLQEIIHVEEFEPFCLDMASHQAILSGSARRLIENYIVAVTANPKTENALHVYRNLKCLANSIQPVTLKPFLQSTLDFCLKNFEKERDGFEKCLHFLKDVLTGIEIQDVNKNIIEEVVTEILFVVSMDSEAFPLLLHCIPLSPKGLKTICKFNEQFNEAEFIKVTKIISHVSRYSTLEYPLVWLNDIISCACKNNIQISLYFDDFTSPLIEHSAHDKSPLWLTDLFGEIQAKVADRCDLFEIKYYCDILAIAVVYFSGLYVTLPKYGIDEIKYFLPAALCFLLDEPMWSLGTGQILEWLHHMNCSESVPENYKRIFGWALCALRHQEDFSKSSAWLKYFDCEVHTSNIDS